MAAANDRAVVAIAGSSGLIGAALTTALRADDHRVVRIVRRPPASADEVSWNPEAGVFDARALDGVDAVVNLCGVNIGDQRWSGAFKQSLRDSRIDSTEVLSNAVVNAGVPVLVNSSAVGYYGHGRDRVLDETADAGEGFLATLCEDWEAATAAATQADVRVVLVRTGLVLSRNGGLLARLKPLFRLGLGARLGDGRQYVPWISLSDEVRALRFVIGHDEVVGPVNATGPAPVTNAEFTSALGRAVHRPTPTFVPGFALRVLLGEFADEGILTGQRAIPAALERAGFEFGHRTIGEALAYAMRPSDPSSG